MKGIITDLDNTLWGGIVGELGASKVDFTGMYEQYQTMLSKLAEEGILIAIASKNDCDGVEVNTALNRTDLKVPLKYIYPIQVNWGWKHDSVANIIQTWNILSEDILFIDDSQYELTEVQFVYPLIKTLKFPRNEEEFPEFIKKLREYFPKRQATKEDALRMESIRSGVQFTQEFESVLDPEEFYRGLGGLVIVEPINDQNIDRAVELINKSNQFNMNGWKTTKEDIQKLMSSLGSCGYVVYYHDKFGDLGIIGVVTGKLITDEKGKICLSLANFSLSCRAFNRRIEYGILKVLFSMVDTLHFNVVPTEKNTPFMQFYSSIGGTPFFSVEKYTSPKTYFMIILRGPTTIK